MKQPLLFEIDGQNYGVLIDKMNNRGCKLTVKNKVTSLEDWNHPIKFQSTMSCLFDNNRLMKEGEIMKRMNDNYTKRAQFFTQADTKRRVKMEGMLFRPAHSSDKELWSRVRDYSTNESVDSINFKKEFANIDLSEIFFELTRLNSKIS